jgi:hypothetical protein
MRESPSDVSSVKMRLRETPTFVMMVERTTVVVGVFSGSNGNGNGSSTWVLWDKMCWGVYVCEIWKDGEGEGDDDCRWMDDSNVYMYPFPSLRIVPSLSLSLFLLLFVLHLCFCWYRVVVHMVCPSYLTYKHMYHLS